MPPPRARGRPGWSPASAAAPVPSPGPRPPPPPPPPEFPAGPRPSRAGAPGARRPRRRPAARRPGPLLGLFAAGRAAAEGACSFSAEKPARRGESGVEKSRRRRRRGRRSLHPLLLLLLLQFQTESLAEGRPRGVGLFQLHIRQCQKRKRWRGPAGRPRTGALSRSLSRKSRISKVCIFQNLGAALSPALALYCRCYLSTAIASPSSPCASPSASTPRRPRRRRPPRRRSSRRRSSRRWWSSRRRSSPAARAPRTARRRPSW